MPQAVPAIVATVVKAATAFAAAYKAHLVVRVATAVTLAVVSGAVAKKLAKKPSQSGGFDQGTEIKLKLDPQMPRQIALGRCATGGSLVAAWTYTNPAEPDSPNKYLIRVIALSDYPTNRLLNVWEGTEQLTFATDLNADPVASSGPIECLQHRNKDGAACMWIKYVKGSFTPTPNYALVAGPGSPWTNDHLGVGISYVWVQYAWDADAFPNGEPALTFELEGAPVYDNRKDGSLPARTGSHRLSNPLTWEYTDNTAANIAQVLRGFHVNNKLIIGAQAEIEDLPDSMLVAALNTCDQNVDTLDGTEKRYRCGMMISADQTVESILEDLQIAMDGNIYDRAGEVTILPGGTRTPVMDLTDSDVIWTDEKSWQPKAELDNMYNFMTGTFVSPVDGFIEKPLPPLKNDSWQAQDGGERLTKSVSMKAVWSFSQGQRTLSRIHKASRFQGIITVMFPFWCAELEQGDWLTFTSPRWDMEEKTFEVATIALTPDLRWAIIGKEVSASIDEWDPVDEEVPDADFYPTPPSTQLIVPVLDVEAYTLEDTFGALKLPGFHVRATNIKPESNIIAVEFQGGYYIGTTLTNVLPYGQRPIASPEINVVGNIIPGALYAFRARSFNGIRYSEWSSYYTETAAGEFIVPETKTFGGKTPDEWVTEIEQIVEDGNTALAELDQLIKQQRYTAQAVLQLFQRHVEERDYLNPLTHIGDTPVGNIVIQEQVRTDDLVELTDAIAVWNGDKSAVILKIATVTTDGTETLANLFTGLTVADANNAAAITSEQTARINGDSSNATSINNLTTTFNNFQSTTTTSITSLSNSVSTQNAWWTLLGSVNGGNTAFVLNGGTTYVDSATSLATYRTGVQTSLNNNATDISNEITARSTGDSAIIDALNVYKVEVGNTYASITNLNSVDSKYGAKVGTTLNVNGHITGWSLNNNGNSGGAVFVVDYFAVVNNAGSVAQTPFSISGSVVRMSNVEVDTLKADTVYAKDLRQNSLGNVAERSGGSIFLAAGSNVAFGSSLTFTAGQSAMLLAFMWLDVQNNGGVDTALQFFFSTDALTIPTYICDTVVKAGTRESLSFSQLAFASSAVTNWQPLYTSDNNNSLINQWKYTVLSLNRFTA